MGTYLPTIGLEIHAELNTQTKMFCNSKNDPDEAQPNVNICPVCMAHPGTLPVINGEAVRQVLRVGIALGARLADYTEFDRKNYFYPDLPKGYQLSQYEYPLVSGGKLSGVSITRIHLEEDTASSVHDEESGGTTIDYNRAGVPLMELVTEPVIHSAEEAGAFARELQLLLRTLGVSDANMEKGEMRVEANVSVGKEGKLGTKVEIKNLNSFRAMERAVAHEIKRQIALLERGGSVEQQTLGWDEKKHATFPQRLKEGSADYRYFPDPDLPSLKLSELPAFGSARLKSGMPELPWERRERFQSLGVRSEDADLFVRQPALGKLFEDAVSAFGAGDRGIQIAANYIANDLINLIRDSHERDTESHSDISISAQNFNKIIRLVRDGKISSRTVKNMLAAYVSGEAADPEVYVKQQGLLQEDISEKKLTLTIQGVIREQEGVVADFRSGRDAALEYLVGQTMRRLRGAADPTEVRRLLKENILDTR
jgi:aspartyl-tRNA(Asn)/glutamyl-tRNA(Gln) amidotransferase subunit B